MGLQRWTEEARRHSRQSEHNRPFIGSVSSVPPRVSWVRGDPGPESLGAPVTWGDAGSSRDEGSSSVALRRNGESRIPIRANSGWKLASVNPFSLDLRKRRCEGHQSQECWGPRGSRVSP